VITQPATVKVVASAASLTLKDSQLTVGQKWQASDNFVSGTDALGQPLELTQGVTIEGQVNTNQAGVYPLTYHYRDVAGNEVAQTITVTVLAVPDPVTPPTESIILPKTGPSTQPVSTTVQDSVVKRSITRTVTATAPTSITLPKTGERIERQLVTAGLALLGVTGLLALLVTRKRRN
jgi:Bacterial Ig-like domain (group 3).